MTPYRGNVMTDDKDRICFDPASPAYVLFHRAWTAAVDTPGYDKAIWLDMERRLTEAARPAPKDRPLRISVRRSGSHWRADAVDIPGCPPVGAGQNPSEAVGALVMALEHANYAREHGWPRIVVDVEGRN
jgi:hypothetical protein